MRQERSSERKMVLGEMLTIIRGNGQNILFTGAEEDQVKLLENQLGQKLPPAYKEFLMFTNGAALYQTEEFLGSSDEEIFGCELRTSISTFQKKIPKLPGNLIPFHRNVRDIHCFDSEKRDKETDECEVVQWNSKEGIARIVASSFIDWFEKYIINEYE